MNEQPKLSAMMFSSEEVMALPRSQEPEWNIESKTSFWNNPFGKLIRWLAFIPVGFVLGSILQVLPPLGVELARSYEPEFNFLTILIAVFAVSILGIVGWFWVLGVFATPVLSCRIIAPNRRVGSVILGTLFCLVLDMYMLGLFGQASWVFILYQLVFSAIFIFGIITAYNEDGAIIVAAVFFWRTNTQRTPSIAEEQSRSEAPTSKSRGDEPVKAGKPINWREVKFGNDEAQYGASLIRSGIRDYRSWSESMALKYGEPVRENLSSIYSEAETRAAAVDAMEQESRELLGPSV